MIAGVCGRGNLSDRSIFVNFTTFAGPALGTRTPLLVRIVLVDVANSTVDARVRIASHGVITTQNSVVILRTLAHKTVAHNSSQIQTSRIVFTLILAHIRVFTSRVIFTVRAIIDRIRAITKVLSTEIRADSTVLARARLARRRTVRFTVCAFEIVLAIAGVSSVCQVGASSTVLAGRLVTGQSVTELAGVAVDASALEARISVVLVVTDGGVLAGVGVAFWWVVASRSGVVI